MIKKSFALLLALLLMVAVLLLPTTAASGAGSKLCATVVGQACYNTIGTGDVIIAVSPELADSVPGLAAYVVTVQWDPQALTPVTNGTPESFCHFTDDLGTGAAMIPDGTTVVNAANLSKGTVTISSSLYNRSTTDGALFLLHFHSTGKQTDPKITVTLGSTTVTAENALSSDSGVIKNVVKNTDCDVYLAPLLGDINADGEINVLDYLRLKSYYLEWIELTKLEERATDVNRDGVTDALDYFVLKCNILRD